MDDTLTSRIAAWIAEDPDDATRAELARLRAQADAGDAAAAAEVTDAFAGRLAFGTAGLRAAMGPGPNRMNRVVVTQASWGFGRWLREDEHFPAGGRVLVGYDARHDSDMFARDTAEVLTGLGLAPWLTATHVPTPVVAFGLKHLGAAGAVQVTASHNPARDNGYKVYNADGSQIVPPMDAQIATRIGEMAGRPVSEAPRSAAYETTGDDLIDAYVARIATLVADARTHDLVWAYTPMHGVGGAVMERIVAATGFPAPVIVAQQFTPDPDFPTVSFPNPEEPGAMDLVIAAAERAGADIAIATDPDADRCGVAAKMADGWRRLTGDEVGVLLGDDAMRRGTPGVFACSIVSSTMLRTMATARRRIFVPTLTGFKWIGRVPGLAFGYEEAIGYCCDPAHTADKDGLSAMVVLLRLAAELKAAGRTIADRLDEIDAEFGPHTTTQHSVRVEHLGQIADMMARLRAAPPSSLAGEPVTARDWLTAPANGLIATDAVEFTGERIHVVVRPSGTEPKLKCYLEARATPEAARHDLAGARTANRATLDAVWDQLATVLGA